MHTHAHATQTALQTFPVSPSSSILTTFISILANSYRSRSILALRILAFFSSVSSVPRHSPIPSAHLLSESCSRGEKSSNNTGGPDGDQPEPATARRIPPTLLQRRKLQGEFASSSAGTREVRIIHEMSFRVVVEVQKTSGIQPIRRIASRKKKN